MTQSQETVRAKLERAYGADLASDGGKVKADAKQLEVVVREHANLVRRLARRFSRASGGAIDIDDLTSVGMMGLIDAHRRYDPAGGRSFAVYAEFRVRGAIIDEMRRMDPMTQPMRRKARGLSQVKERLTQELGRVPGTDELADQMSLTLDELQRLQRDVQPQIFLGDDTVSDICDNLATSALDKVSLKSMVSKAIGSLSERNQQVLALYYFQDLTLREIGQVLEITEARVCQLHKEAVEKMRFYLHTEGAIG